MPCFLRIWRHGKRRNGRLRKFLIIPIRFRLNRRCLPLPVDPQMFVGILQPRSTGVEWEVNVRAVARAVFSFCWCTRTLDIPFLLPLIYIFLVTLSPGFFMETNKLESLSKNAAHMAFCRMTPVAQSSLKTLDNNAQLVLACRHRLEIAWN